MHKSSLILLVLVFGCSSIQKGTIGYVIMDDPLDEGKESVKLYKDKRYVIWGKGCLAHDHFAPVTDQMIMVYNKVNHEGERAYGMADIEYENYVSLLIPCLKMKGTPLIKTERKENSFIPIDLNYKLDT